MAKYKYIIGTIAPITSRCNYITHLSLGGRLIIMLPGITMVQVPISLLLDKRLHPTSALLWIALRFSGLGAGIKPDKLLSPSRLSRLTGISRQTIRNDVAQLIELGWFLWPAVEGRTIPMSVYTGSRIVYIPCDLVTDENVSTQAKLLYGLLQHIHEYKYKNQGGWTTYRSLSLYFNLNVKTVRRAMLELRNNGWLIIKQANQKSPIHFTLSHPTLGLFWTIIRHIENAQFRGEALMREWLSLLIDSTEYADNGYYGFLVNPETNEQMQLDRYYMNYKVAFEFNGDQHYESTALYDKDTAAKQKRRDRIKEEICRDKGITLVDIRRENLNNIVTLLQNLPIKLPLRNLVPERYGLHINYLVSMTKRYQEACRVS